MPTATLTDSFSTGTIVAARLARETLARFDPVLRSLLAGQQFFVKLADGRWHPQGCQLGLCQCFEFGELQGAVARGSAPRPADD
ncbi:MAG TPA: hypothetical protein VFM98_12125 [Ramlibacter sp.]|uniref:hypothetical protein n=1 Tax=Ramlibacter sp. TaxID=1917967 RepID=UPI002D7F6E63|nr:hypothetical protein [Ramlibacter sp.]HET8746346.1 hypothetical protein [Ramlibacter sp.]